MTAIFKPPPIGKLRHRIVIEALTGTPDGAGGTTTTWTQFGVVWGAIRPRHGSEAFDGGRVEGRVTHDIWVRSFTGLAPGQRLRTGARLFNIRAVLRPDEFVNRIRLICEERDL